MKIILIIIINNNSNNIIIIIIVTHPFYESRMHWIPDPMPSPPRRTGMDYSDPLVKPSDPPVPIPSDSVRPREIS